MIETTQLMTLEEFVRLYEQEGAFELIDGQRRPIMPPVAIHVLTIRALFLLLHPFCTAHNLGEIIQEMPFVLTHDSDWVIGSRTPDLMFVAAARWAKYIAETPDWLGKPLVLAPDLAVEVVSPNDRYTEIEDKVDHYLQDGVRLVWVVDPQRSRVMVYQGKEYARLGKEDTLSGGEVIPGLQVKLAELFK